MDIVLIHASMLSDLGSGGEDHAGVDFEKNVRSPFVVQWAVEFIGHRLQRKDLLNSQRCLVGGVFRLSTTPAVKEGSFSQMREASSEMSKAYAEPTVEAGSPSLIAVRF